MINNNTYDQEGDMINLNNLSIPNPTAKPYPRFNCSRILRMSRGNGGKDRHTKVWTLKGIKDRRIRLSEPAALILYRLQDRLGLSQPSKVIDWLLNVTKDDIDKLPPLQMALEDFNPFYFPSTFVHDQDFNSTQLSNEHEPSSNLSFSQHFNSTHLLNTYEPSFCPQCMVHNHSQFVCSCSPHMVVPHNLNDTQEKVLLGLNMSSKVSSDSNKMADGLRMAKLTV